MLVSGYWMVKSIYIFYPASSTQYPVSAHTDINVRFQNFVFFGSGFRVMFLWLNKFFPGTLSRNALQKIPRAIKTAGF